jgi:hypothetical protein
MTDQNRNPEPGDTQPDDRPADERRPGSDWSNEPDMTRQGGQGSTYGQGTGLGREGQGGTWRGDQDDDETEQSREGQGTGTPR